MKKIFVLFLTFCVVIGLYAKKRYIVIEYMSAEQQELELKKVSTIEFAGKYIYFLDRLGEEIAGKKIKDIRKISFIEGKTAVEDISDIAMIVYPNPTMDALFVQGLNKGDVVRIYALDGTLVKSQIVEEGVLQINVDDIAVGSYLLQSNTNVVKFIKK